MTSGVIHSLKKKHFHNNKKKKSDSHILVFCLFSLWFSLFTQKNH